MKRHAKKVGSLTLLGLCLGLLSAATCGCRKGKSSSSGGSRGGAQTRTFPGDPGVEHVFQPTTREVTDRRWQKFTIALPDGMGTLALMRLATHEFLAEYDRKVTITSARGKATFDLPPNTGGRTKIDVYLVKTEAGRQVWLHDAHDWNSAYVFHMDTLSFEILGENKYWNRGPIGGPFGVRIPPAARLLGTITAIYQPPWLSFVEPSAPASSPGSR